MPDPNATLGAATDDVTSTSIDTVTGGGTGAGGTGSVTDTAHAADAESAAGEETTPETPIEIEDLDAEEFDSAMPAELRTLISQNQAAAPQIQRIWDRLANYASIFPTPREAREFRDMFPGGLDDARSLQEKAAELDKSNELIYSNDPTQQLEVLEPMFEDNPEAFMGLTKVSLDLVQQKNPQLYQTFANGIISDHLQGQKFGVHLESMENALHGLASDDDKVRTQAVNALADLTHRLVGWGKKNGYVGKERDLGRREEPRPDPRVRSLENENKTLRQSQWTSFANSVNLATKPKIEGSIRKLMEPALKGVPEKQRKVTTDLLVNQASVALEARLKADQTYQRQYAEWAKSKTIPDSAKAISFIVGRAQAHMRAVVKSILDPWAKSFVDDKNRVADKTNTTGTRVDVAGSTSVTGRNIKNNITQSEANSMKPEDILNWSRTQYDKRARV